ncbi:MAG: winged helix DNA-binding protein [Arachidicoccus sp.]|nr:winged helix DNA-binding protein [Arachidicoccus sp.]
MKPAASTDLEPVRIMSSAHLAAGPHTELSELEFGLIIAHNAFSRWVTRCMAAAGEPDLAFNDILVLHHVHHRDRGKKLADICFTLNYEDTHVINYALKKLAAQGLVHGAKVGKEVVYGTTEAGAALIDRFRAIRGRCLLAGIEGDLADGESHAEVARRLRMLSGLYDQAARAASSL